MGNIMHKNLILLFKWWWRFSESDNTLWKRVIRSVYDIKGFKSSSESFSKIKDGPWSQLLSNDADTSKIRSIIEEGMIVKVENGSSVRFWHDNWCEGGQLKRVVPRLFTISLQKNCLISQMGTWNDGAWSWNLRWRRILYDWELDDLQRLTRLIELNKPNSGMADGLYWKHSGDLYFPVKQIGAIMYDTHTPTLSKPIINFIWQKFIPPRAQLPIWMANREKLKTGDILVKKGIITLQQAVCPFCNLETESNYHILFTCSFSWNV